MKSNNPVFARSESFNGPTHNAYGNATYPGNGAAFPGYGQPDYGRSPYGQPGQPMPGQGYGAPVQAGRPMTIDTVVQKTALSVGVVVIAAFAAWAYIGNAISLGDPGAMQRAFALMTVGSLGAFALSMVNSFKRVISPALVIAFAALQGVAIGGLSKIIDARFADGVVSGAVIGTFGAFLGTLAAFKFFDIKVGNKFRMFTMAAVFGMVGLGLMSFILSFFNINTGLFGFGTLGMITAIVGLVLGVFMLILDFDFVQQGIANGLPERESWRAAFAMTVSLVWIYTNLLRLLAIFSQD